MVQQNYIPYKEVAGKLNIQKGDTVLLTSDILRLAIKARKSEREFDIDAFIDSFSDVLGPEGTLLIPAYNFDLESGDSYSIKDTEPMTGSLAVSALKRGDFIRTSNPLHSFLVKGKDTRALADLNNESSFGADSPFAYLHKKNALMIFAGTGIAEAMTFTHFVEESERVKYRRFREIRIRYDGPDSTVIRKFKLYNKKPGWTMKLDRIEEVLSHGLSETVFFNGIPFSLIRCEAAYNTVRDDIRHNKAGSIAGFSIQLFIRDIIKEELKRFNLFRTTYSKIRSGKRIY